MRSLYLCLVCAVNCTGTTTRTPPSGAPQEVESNPMPKEETVEPVDLEPLPLEELRDGVPRPIVSRYNYAIEFGDYGFEVDPTEGGRIVRFSLRGDNVLATYEQSPAAHGSTFWPSPQSDWNWPPPIEWDRAPWRARVEGRALVLESQTSATLQLSAKQHITAEPENGAVKIEYAITNHGSQPRKVACWQNSRVPPNGLTFYPSPDGTLPNSSLQLASSEGVVWLRHDPATMRSNAKAFGDGREGWLAHVAGELLFVKLFPEVPREAQAPGEGEIELYVHETGEFVEVEQQGPHQELAPGKSSFWTVRWLLRKIPKGIHAEPGNLAIVEYVRSLVAAVDQPKLDVEEE